ncbi:MAG: YbhB/YbcL family Raf kinase inhibitor-like protein [Thermodesulfobacteriota bacterium]
MNGLSIYFILCVLVFPISESMSQEAGKTGILKISSPAFENNKPIPKKYTCDGVNVNPPLKIENVPREAKSLALILDDKDAPRGTYVHWILWGIHPGLAKIRENSVPEGAVQGRNDFKKNNYGGPCPPSRAHRYVFKAYALDVQMNLDPKSMKADLEKAMEGHIIARGEWVGVYKRK